MSVVAWVGRRLVSLDRNPIAVYLLGLAALSGIASFFRATPVGLPTMIVIVWNVFLTFGALTALAGTFWKDAITGVLIVRAALIPLGIGAYLYTFPIATVIGLWPALATGSFGFACHLRCWQITRHVRGETRNK